MLSGKKKELNLAKSIGELNKLASLQDKISKNANPKPWLKSAEKVYKNALSDDLSGDEENAYVFYMRFFNIMQEVTKTSKYQADQKYYDSLIGKTTLSKAIDRAEKLAESLTERYKKLAEETKAVAIEKERQAKEKEKSVQANAKNVNGMTSNSLQDIDDLLNGKKISSQTSADVYKKLHVNHTSILSPSDKNADEKESTTPEKKENSDEKSSKENVKSGWRDKMSIALNHVVKFAREKERSHVLPDGFFKILDFLEHVRFFDDLKGVEVTIDRQNQKIRLNGRDNEYYDACRKCDENLLNNLKKKEYVLKDALMWDIISNTPEHVNEIMASKNIKAKR